MKEEKIDEVMNQAVERGVFPAAQLLVAKNETLLYHQAYGRASLDMCFDIASLTKPIATATLAMHLFSEGKIKLEETLSKWFKNVAPSHAEIALYHLLSHTSGLSAWRSFYRELPSEMIGTEEGKNYILKCCLNEPLVYKTGTSSEYSDLGYILLGAILEEVGGASLDKLFAEKITKPLGLKNTFFNPKHQHILPTEDCPWRKKVLRGEVHDQNAYAMGGVAGHAGLFSNAEDIHRFITELLHCYHGRSNWIPQEIVQQFLDFDLTSAHFTGTYVLGWDTPTFATSSAGRYFSPHSIGHLGYTGCSMWIDLDQNFWVILLTNRIHPTTANHKIKTFRPRIHNLIWKTFKESRNEII